MMVDRGTGSSSTHLLGVVLSNYNEAICVTIEAVFSMASYFGLSRNDFNSTLA